MCRKGENIRKRKDGRWEDVDFAQYKIRIQRTVIRIKNLDQTANPDTEKIPKTILYIGPPKIEHSNREIPLPDKLLFYAKRFRKDGSAYILSGTARCMKPRPGFIYFIPNSFMSFF